MHTEGLIKLTVMRMHNTDLYNSGYIIGYINYRFFQTNKMAERQNLNTNKIALD